MRTLAERLIEASEDKGWTKADLRRAAKLKSPKCGSATIESAALAEPCEDDYFTCGSCGYRAAKSEFFADMLGEAAKLFRNALGNIPGFKSK